MKFWLLLYLLPYLVFSQSNQNRGVKLAADSAKGKIALVVGNWAYSNDQLVNPKNDASEMSKVLSGLGFYVVPLTNLSTDAMQKAIREFTGKLPKYQVGLFYFAGHGFESNHINYLLSTDAGALSDAAVAKAKSLNLNNVINDINRSSGRTTFIVIDACRTKLAGSMSHTDSLSLEAMHPAKGTIVFFATSSDQPADDNPTGRNGLFTQEFLKQINRPNVKFSDVVNNTTSEVLKRSHRQQHPYVAGDFPANFYFRLEKPSNKRTILYYSLAAASLAASAITYAVITTKYNEYMNTTTDRNSQYTYWYRANYSGPAPESDLIHPDAKFDFARGPIIGSALSALGGLLLINLGNRQNRDYKFINNELRKHPPTVSLAPIVNPIQPWTGLSVCLHL